MFKQKVEGNKPCFFIKYEHPCSENTISVKVYFSNNCMFWGLSYHIHTVSRLPMD